MKFLELYTDYFAHIVKCSATGPKAKDGMYVKAPTKITVPTNKNINKIPEVGKVPLEGGIIF